MFYGYRSKRLRCSFVFIGISVVLLMLPALIAAQEYEEPVFREAKIFINIYGGYADTVVVFGTTDFHWTDRYFDGVTDVIDMEFTNPKLYGEIEGFDCISILGEEGSPSPGKSEFPEPGGDFPIESFFDIFKIKLYAPMLSPDTLHTNSPMHITSVIDQMPPYFNDYELPSGNTVLLYDVGETVVGEITFWQEEMTPYSPPEAYITAETSYGSDIAVAHDDTIAFSAAVAGYIEPDPGIPPCDPIDPVSATFGIRESGSGNPFTPFYTDTAGLGEEVGTEVPMNEGDGWAGYLDISSYPDAGSLYDVEVNFDYGYFSLRDTLSIFIDPTSIIPQFVQFSRDSIGSCYKDTVNTIKFQIAAHANEVIITTLSVQPLSSRWKRTLETVDQHDLTRNKKLGNVSCGPAAGASCLKFWAKNGYPKLDHPKGNTTKPEMSIKKVGRELITDMKPKSSTRGVTPPGMVKGIKKFLKNHDCKGWSVERKRVNDMTDFASMMREFEADSEDVIMIVSDTTRVGGKLTTLQHALTLGSRQSITYLDTSTTNPDTAKKEERVEAEQKIDFMDPYDGTNTDDYEIIKDKQGNIRINGYTNTNELFGNAKLRGYIKVSPPSSKSSSAPPSSPSNGWSPRYRMPANPAGVLYGSWTIVDSVPTSGDSQVDTLHWDTTGFPGGLYLMELTVTGTDGRVGKALRFAAIPEYLVDADIPNAPQLATAIRSSFPNPFNPTTTIEYSVMKKTSITMRVFDVTGKLITTLIENEVKEPGIYRTVWDGSNVRGNRVASGIYFCVLSSRDGFETKKLILLK